MNQLVSLFCCLVACSRRKRGNRQTDTLKPSTKPSSACAPRVNNYEFLTEFQHFLNMVLCGIEQICILVQTWLKGCNPSTDLKVWFP